METNSPENNHGEASDFAVGAVVFGKFEILAFISSGAKGRVYKAKDVVMDNIVALKVLKTDSHSQKALMRFQSEARIASKLNHPGIATIFDFGLFGTIPYLSMEFVEGESLESLVARKQTLPLGEFLDIFIQVSTALVHAHNHGVVHRDIKPANIVIRTNADGSLHAKVLDFGVAKKIDLVVEHEGKLTPTGDIVGSPFYMSPEQSHGFKVTPKSDNYSLGCLMWETLAGNPPLAGDTAMETLLLHQSAVPKKLSECALDELPPELTITIDKMLSKEPEQRPDLRDVVIPLLQSIQEKELDASQPSVLQAESATETAETRSMSISSRQWRFIGIALIASSLLAAAFIARCTDWLQFNKLPAMAILQNTFSNEFVDELEANTASQLARKKKKMKGAKELNFGLGFSDQDMKDIAGQSTVRVLVLDNSQITDDSLSAIKTLPNLEVLSLDSTDITKLDNIDKLEKLTALDLNNTMIDDAALDTLKGLKKLKVLRLTSVRRITDGALSKVARIASLEELDLSNTKLKFEFIEELKKLKNLKKLDLSRTSITEADVRKITLMPKLESIDITECKNLSQHAQTMLARDFPILAFPPRRSIISTLTDQASDAMKVRNTKLAVRCYEEVAGLIVRHSGDRDVSLFPYYLTLGSVELQNNDLDQAQMWYQKAKIVSEAGGDELSKLLPMDGLNQVAFIRGGSKMTPKMESRFLKTQKIAEKVLGTNASVMASRFFTLGDFYMVSGDYAKAIIYYEKNLDMMRKLGSSQKNQDVVEVGRAHLHIAECWREMKKYEKALPHYELGLSVFEQVPNLSQVYGETMVRAIAGYTHMAMSDHDYGRALSINDRAIKLFARVAVSNPWQSIIYKQRAEILRFQGHKAESLIADKKSKALSASGK